MRIFLYAFLLVLISCNNNNGKNNVETVEKIIPSKFVVMTITFKNNRTDEINKRFKKFNVYQENPIETYVSEVKEYQSELNEDFKYKMLDIFEQKMLHQLGNNYIVLKRDFEIFDNYAEASKARELK